MPSVGLLGKWRSPKAGAAESDGGQPASMLLMVNVRFLIWIKAARRGIAMPRMRVGIPGEQLQSGHPDGFCLSLFGGYLRGRRPIALRRMRHAVKFRNDINALRAVTPLLKKIRLRRRANQWP